MELATDNNDEDTLLSRVDIEYMLEFETEIFLDIVRSDGLVIAAKGLNLDLVLLNVLKVYQDPGNLVLVLNATDAEQKYFDEKLNFQHVYIEHDTGDTRIEEYLCGGIHFLPARILVVDLLKKRIPIDKVTGIIVLRAHRIFESCNEAFVLKLYRQHNKTGFIKAFSNSPQSFTIGFSNVERVMRALFVKDLHIWPRFHALVRSSLKKHEPQVVELHIPISDQMKKLQTYILEIMNNTVKELKRLNPGLELQEITVENCLIKKFHKILQNQMNDIWHQLSSKSTQLIAELKALRHLLLLMFHTDPIKFYKTILEYRKVDYARTVDWVLSQSAELLFRDASALVYSGDKELNPEFCPKWEALLEILKVEIPAEIKKNKTSENTTVLILCSDQQTCYQLNELLTAGPHLYLFSQALRNKVPFKKLSSNFQYCGELQEVAKSDESGAKSKTGKSNKRLKTGNEAEESSGKIQAEEEELENEGFQSTYILTMSQNVLKDCTDESLECNESGRDETTFTPSTQMENMNITQVIDSITAPKVLIQTFKGGENYISLQNNLQILKPNIVIMYHSNITAVREIEMYEAHRQSGIPLKIYFLIHAATVEEQAYLTTLRREKESFEYLIEAKANMVVQEDQDGKSDQCLALQRGSLTPEKNTRQGGQIEEPAKRVVIVDMREFQSDLPSLIHKRGIEIEPVTITVGDYILTPDICVERKSISDLISSLSSGRLYQQCMQMQRAYSKPMLLIEFDQNTHFGWKSQYMISEDGTSFGIQEKLLLLTIHFPKLKIIWSPSPYATAQLFEELKQGKEEPNIEGAMAIGENDLDLIETKYNSNIYDFVQKLPGITSKNVDKFLRSGINMQTVLNKSEGELKDILGNANDAKALHSVLHVECNSKQDTKEKPKYNRGAGKSNRGGYWRGK